MEPALVSILGFGAAVVLGGLLMVAISFFSMKESSYETAVLKKRKAVVTDDKEVKTTKQPTKRDHTKKKLEVKKRKNQIENGKVSQSSAESSDNIKTNTTLHHSDKSSHPPMKEASEDTKTKSPKAKNDIQPVISPKLETNRSTSNKNKKIEAAELKKTAHTKSIEKSVKLDESVKKKESGEEKGKLKSKPIKQVNQTDIKQEKKSGDIKQEKKSGDMKQEKKSGDIKQKVSRQNDIAILDMINAATLEDAEIDLMINQLIKKSGKGDWTRADRGSKRNQHTELQKQLNIKSTEFSQQNQELAKHQEKVKQLLGNVETMKKQIGQLEQSKHENNEKKLQLEKLVEEKNKEIFKLQNQVYAASDVTGVLKQLKEENEILRSTIQANASVVSVKDRFHRELQLLQGELDDSNRNCKELECKLTECSQLLSKKQSETEANTKLIEELTLKVCTSEGHHSTLQSDFQKVQNDLQISQSECAKLINQVVMLTEASEQHSLIEKDIATTKQELEQRLIEMDANEAQEAEDVAKLHMRNKDLSKIIQELKTKEQSHKDELINYQLSVAKMTEERQVLDIKLNEKDSAISALKSENETVEEERKKLETEIEKLKIKNNELRERSWKAMDAVAVAEKTCKDRISSNEEKMQQKLQSLAEQLEHAFPTVTAVNSDVYGWISEFVSSASSSFVKLQKDLAQSKEQISVKKPEHDNRLSENSKKNESSALQKSLDGALTRNKHLESELKDLKLSLQEQSKQAEKYKQILKSTEDILQSLQSNVENDEEKTFWNDAKEKELTAATKELEEKSKLLNEVSKDCENLRSKLNEMNKAQQSNDVSQEDQGFLIVEQIEQPSQMESNQSDEITKLKERLEKEKLLTKSLGAAASKLQVVLKQTQDELSKERAKSTSSTPDDA